MSVGAEGFLEGPRHVNVDQFEPAGRGSASSKPLLTVLVGNAQQANLQSGSVLRQSGCDWRPESALAELAMLLEPTRRLLSKLESSILDGDLKSLALLLQGLDPSKDSNLVRRSMFCHAFIVFQLEMATLGFEARYDTRRGVLSLDNQLEVANAFFLQRLVVDPGRKHLIASRKHPEIVGNDTLIYDIDTAQYRERCTQFGPPFKQYTAELSANEARNKYADLLRSQIASRIRLVEREKQEGLSASPQSPIHRINAERKRRREELEQPGEG